MRIAWKLAACAFLFNFAWEMLQGGLFVGMVERPVWEATLMCLQASVGDAAMIVIAYAAVSVASRDPRWIVRGGALRVAAYAVLAALQGLAMEWYSIGAGRWAYKEYLPADPLFGIGLAPLLQWLLLPLLALCILRCSTSRGPVP